MYSQFSSTHPFKEGLAVNETPQDTNEDFTPVLQNLGEVINENTFDPLANIADLRERLKRRKDLVDSQYMKLGFDLFLVYNTEVYRKWGYETYGDYVWGELGIAVDTANVYRRLWKKLQDLGLNEEKLAGIGYSRAQLVSSVLKKDNLDEWLGKARTLSWKDLKSEVKLTNFVKPKHKVVSVIETKAQPGSTDMMKADIIADIDGPKIVKDEETLVKKDFFFYPEQLRFVIMILQEMEKDTGSSKEGYNLVTALMEFQSNRVKCEKSDKPLLMMRGFELAFGGKLLWVKNGEQLDALNKLISENQELFGGSIIDD